MAQTTERVLAIRRAAVTFANDYGPLSAANNGDEASQHLVGARLFNALKREGLAIVWEATGVYTND